MEELARGLPRPGRDGAARLHVGCRSGWRSPASSLAWYLYLRQPDAAGRDPARASRPIYTLLDNKYYFDWFNENVLAARRARCSARGLWKGGDVGVIDGVIVNGSARTSAGVAGVDAAACRPAIIYHYAFVMILGVFGLMTWQFVAVPAPT